MMSFLVLEALTLVTVLLEISTKLYVIEESAPSLMTRSFSEGMKSHHHLSRPLKIPGF
jgi:hypothetical protein